MRTDLAGEIDILKGLLSQSMPVLIKGIDFLALNYGDEVQKHSMAGCNTVISGHTGSAVISRETGEWEFLEPNIRIVNASHILELERVRVNVTFEGIKESL